MSQITAKWIADGAITPAKLDSNGDYTVGSISVNILDTSNIVTSSIVSLSEAYDVPALDASSSDSETPAILAQHSTGAAIVALSGDGIAVSALNNSSTFVALKAENVAPGGTCFEAQTASVDGTAVSIIANTEASSIALQAFGVVDVNGTVRVLSEAYNVPALDASSSDSETPAILAQHSTGTVISAISGDGIAVSALNDSSNYATLKAENLGVGGACLETNGISQFNNEFFDGPAIRADNSSVETTVRIRNYGTDVVALNVGSGKTELEGPVRMYDTVNVYNEFVNTLVSLENGLLDDPSAVTLEVKGYQGTAITASSYDGTALKTYEASGGLAAHFDGNILSENGTVTLGSNILDKSIILADNSSIEPTVRFQNLGTDAVALEVSGKTNLGGPTSVFDTLTVQNEFASTLVTFNNELIDEPAAITLDVQGLQGTTIKAVSSNDGTAIKAISTGTGLAGHFDGNILSENGTFTLGSDTLDKAIIRADSSSDIESTVRIRNLGNGPNVVALEVSGSVDFGDPTVLHSTLNVQSEFENTLVTFNNELLNEPAAKTLDVQGAQGTTISSTAGSDGTAGYFSSGGLALHIDSGDIMVGSDIGDTTAAVIGGVTFNFTKGILTSIT